MKRILTLTIAITTGVSASALSVSTFKGSDAPTLKARALVLCGKGGSLEAAASDLNIQFADKAGAVHVLPSGIRIVVKPPYSVSAPTLLESPAPYPVKDDVPILVHPAGKVLCVSVSSTN